MASIKKLNTIKGISYKITVSTNTSKDTSNDITNGLIQTTNPQKTAYYHYL